MQQSFLHCQAVKRWPEIKAWIFKLSLIQLYKSIKSLQIQKHLYSKRSCSPSRNGIPNVKWIWKLKLWAPIPPFVVKASKTPILSEGEYKNAQASTIVHGCLFKLSLGSSSFFMNLFIASQGFKISLFWAGGSSRSSQ